MAGSAVRCATAVRTLRHSFPLFLALVASCGSARAQEAAQLRTGPPAWAQDAVWYVVQPDRFRNGDPRNDPKVSDLRGAALRGASRVSGVAVDGRLVQAAAVGEGHGAGLL